MKVILSHPLLLYIVSFMKALLLKFISLILISHVTLSANTIDSSPGIMGDTIANDEQLSPYPSISGSILSIVPGVILHGSGHYFSGEKETGKDLMKLQGYSFLGMASSLLGVVYTAGSGKTAPILYPIGYFSLGVFMSTWFADIMGTSGLTNVLNENSSQFQRNYIRLSYVSQDDVQSPYFDFFNLSAQYATSIYFIRIESELERQMDFQDYKLMGGYLLSSNQHWWFYTIPEFRYQKSSEGFSLSKSEINFHHELNLGKYWKTLKNIYFENWLGFGRVWYHIDDTPDYLNDLSTSIMNYGQGFRFNFSDRLEFSTQYRRENDELLNGINFMLLTFHHELQFNLDSYHFRIHFGHGHGYRLASSLGGSF